ncbi:unnamed protein product [Amoebophrya sp. A25]|nr:unnamed protein product [Amoebophrya sp. A25]|eukprot:GSA25T00021781001.1
MASTSLFPSACLSSHFLRNTRESWSAVKTLLVPFVLASRMGRKRTMLNIAPPKRCAHQRASADEDDRRTSWLPAAGLDARALFFTHQMWRTTAAYLVQHFSSSFLADFEADPFVFLTPRKLSRRKDIKMRSVSAPYPRDARKKKVVPHVRGLLEKLIK